LSKLALVTKYLPSIGSDLSSVRAKFLRRRSFATILTILSHVRPGFAAILPDLASVTTKLSAVRANLSAIRAQLPAFGR
jgi:hypothetical protein